MRYITDYSHKIKLFEIKRKIFHLFGFFFPIFTYYLDTSLLLKIALCITVPLVIIDYNNIMLLLLKKMKFYILLNLIRKKERRYGILCGLSWIFIGYVVILSLCDKNLVIIAMSLLIVCDALAAIIGKNFGTIKICNKSLEGTLSFILSGYLVVCILSYYLPIGNMNTQYLILSLIFSAIVELFSDRLRLDDNFSVPLSFCFFYNMLVCLY